MNIFRRIQKSGLQVEFIWGWNAHIRTDNIHNVEFICKNVNMAFDFAQNFAINYGNSKVFQTETHPQLIYLIPTAWIFRNRRTLSISMKTGKSIFEMDELAHFQLRKSLFIIENI